MMFVKFAFIIQKQNKIRYFIAFLRIFMVSFSMNERNYTVWKVEGNESKWKNF